MQGAEKGQAVNLDGRVMHVGIVQARFNDALTGQMAKICIEELIAMGVEADNIRHVTVPGALEVPVALQAMAESENGRVLDYRLTDKGRDLFPIVIALLQWGDRHAPAPEGPPVQVVDRESGRPIALMQVCSDDGRVLQARDVRAKART